MTTSKMTDIRIVRLLAGRGALVAACFLISGVGDAAGEIDNSATAVGDHDGETVRSQPSSQAVPVGDPEPRIAIAISGPEHADLDGDGGYSPGDRLTYGYSITNTGDITLRDPTVEAEVPNFNGAPGQNAMSPVTANSPADVLAPAQSIRFTGEYQLAPLDVYRAAGVANGVVAVARARATRPDNGEDVRSIESTQARSAVPAKPALRIDSSYEITTDSGTIGEANAGDEITYRYIVANTGNVAIENVQVTNAHEGAFVADGLIVEQAGPLESDGPLGNSRDETEGDGVWDLLGPGASVRFEYVHTVTQEEFEAQ